jgi:leader peptidase (prepilin peptidase)/N-methyltransferase
VLVLSFVLAAFFGAAVGSFAGVIASRGVRKSLVGRSHCDRCGRVLQPYELVPLLSFIVLRGRCRTCGARIGWNVYAWEVGGAVLAVAALVLPVALRQ